jgi:hypothetical protein
MYIHVCNGKCRIKERLNAPFGHRRSNSKLHATPCMKAVSVVSHIGNYCELYCDKKRLHNKNRIKERLNAPFGHRRIAHYTPHHA